ncbi:preprotein translocase subunit SecE [Ruminococcus albus]|uniref:Protein translocase subunit SecE n=1 Tax=Ruminococcus albus TaxID=1264 RepID=A0A1H7K5Y9_RUMAL|nr:preprotein translocase subunit SecE [Ruminococcus albus]SEK82283.1 preprotein translocase subunit SecE [Ruminococcus albus]
MAKDAKDTKSKKKDAKEEKKKGGAGKYFKELRAELKKVVWPTRQQVVNNTGVVLVVMSVVGLFLFAVDTGLSYAISKLISLGSG